MSSTRAEPMIMTVPELRKLVGDAVKHLSDEQLEKAIADLDLNAQLFVADVKRQRSTPMDEDEK